MTSVAISQPSLADALRIQLRVIGALFMRELTTRFGRDNLGYLWLFFEPLLLGTAIGSAHLATGHHLPHNLNVFAYYVLGYMPFYLFRGVINRSPSAIQANQSLLYHRRVTVLDIMIARNLVEVASVTGALACFLTFFGMLVDVWPAEPGKMFGALILMGLFCNGVSMLIAAGSVFSEMFDRVTHLFTYLSMPFIGALYMVDWLPTSLQEDALLIPTVHLFELGREGQFGSGVPFHYSLEYIGGWVVILNLLGMLALRVARRKLVI